MNAPVNSTVNAVSESTVTVEGNRTSYWEAGSGSPIVILHRGGGPLWSPTHDLLSQKHRVIMLQQPGFGSSSIPAVSSTRDYAALVHRAARHVAGSTYNLVGSSFGGLVSAWIATQFPAEIESLVLLSPAVFLPQGFGIEVSEDAFDAIHQVEKSHPERHYPHPLSAVDKINNLRVLKQFLVPEDLALITALGRLTVPTLVAFGTEDRVIPAELGRKFPALNPAIFLSFIYDAGHALDDDRPEAVAQMIERFVEHKLDYLIERGRTLLNP